MNFFRGRRLRAHKNIRCLVQETHFTSKQLIMPFFVVEGTSIKQPIASMPGQFHLSIDMLLEEVKKVQDYNLGGVLLFGLPSSKDSKATSAFDENGIVQKALRSLKSTSPNLCLISDVCLCEYTDHGHCGILNEKSKVDNDNTLDILAKIALSHAKAGADIVAPSDMMDGRVGYLRRALDDHAFLDLPIMSYAAKYSSAFYGPFRAAAKSAPSIGDRKTYQMNCANAKEAFLEIEADINEGADIIIVKPALAYGDIIFTAKQRFSKPIAAYNVSGEYAMVKAAAAQGWIDEQNTVSEILTGLFRAGADIVISYHALEYIMNAREVI